MKHTGTLNVPHGAKKLLMISVLVGLLTACAVGPEYRRADLPTSPVFRNAPNTHAITESAWWRGFGDATLDGLVEQALAGNQDIAQAIARLEQAQASARRARAQQRPVISMEASAASQRESLENAIGRVSQGSPAFERNHDDYASGLTLNWEIDLFGRLKRQAQTASAHREAAQADLHGLKIAIAAETVHAYLNWRQASEELSLLEQRIAASAVAVDLTQVRFDAEVSNVDALSLAQASLAELQAGRPALEQIIEVQRNRLAVLTGNDPSRFTLTAPVAPLTLPTVTGFEQPADLLRRRPDVMAAEQRVIAANAAIGSAMAGYYPSFSLNGLLGWQATTTGAFGTGDSAQALGLLGLRWRLFEFGRVEAEIRQASGRYSEALAAWRHTVLLATEEVENALMALETSSDTLHWRRQAHGNLESVWRNARQSFDERAIGRLPVLAAEERMLANQQQHTAALYARANAVVWLNKAAAAL